MYAYIYIYLNNTVIFNYIFVSGCMYAYVRDVGYIDFDQLHLLLKVGLSFQKED